MGSAERALHRLGKLSDATAAEVEEARQSFAEARKAVQPAAALFDVLAAARIDDDTYEACDAASHWSKDVSAVQNSLAHKLARVALTAIPPFHFPIAFPEVFLRKQPGFDVILGNPPWEEATVEEDRFWTRHNPGFHSYSQREQEKEKKRLRKTRPDLVTVYERELAGAELLRRALTHGPFPGMGTGDPDVYKAFVWQFWRLVRGESGRIGVVLPRSAFATKGLTQFRQEIFTDGVVGDITFLLNRAGWVFDDAEHRYTITLASWKRKRPEPESESDLPLRGPFPNEERYRLALSAGPLRFPVPEVLSWTDTAALPLLPIEESGEVFAQLRKAPRLDLNDGKSWRARPHAELHATNDKKLMKFTDNPPEGFWPVFKGESFDIWEPDRGVYYAWADPEKVMAALQKKRMRSAKLARSAFKEFPSYITRDPKTLPCLKPRIAFRDVARATDTRTVRIALLPPNVFITNTAPYFLWPRMVASRSQEQHEAYLLGVMASLPLDWYARRFVEIHLNFHVLNAFPVPRPDLEDVLYQRVVALAGRLASVGKPYREWAKAVGVACGPISQDEKADMIHELDAVVAHLYELSESQLIHIFETFHEGWDYEERLSETVEHYEAWRKKL